MLTKRKLQMRRDENRGVETRTGKYIDGMEMMTKIAYERGRRQGCESK